MCRFGCPQNDYSGHCGIRLGGVVSDINGVSAQEMIQGLIEGKAPAELVTCARGRLKSKAEELFDSLDESLGERH